MQDSVPRRPVLTPPPPRVGKNLDAGNELSEIREDYALSRKGNGDQESKRRGKRRKISSGQHSKGKKMKKNEAEAQMYHEESYRELRKKQAQI